MAGMLPIGGATGSGAVATGPPAAAAALAAPAVAATAPSAALILAWTDALVAGASQRDTAVAVARPAHGGAGAAAPARPTTPFDFTSPCSARACSLLARLGSGSRLTSGELDKTVVEVDLRREGTTVCPDGLSCRLLQALGFEAPPPAPPAPPQGLALVLETVRGPLGMPDMTPAEAVLALRIGRGRFPATLQQFPFPGNLPAGLVDVARVYVSANAESVHSAFLGLSFHERQVVQDILAAAEAAAGRTPPVLVGPCVATQVLYLPLADAAVTPCFVLLLRRTAST
jgi:hypothetical protein